MPYIKKEDRDRIFDGDSPSNAGELNFLITLMIDEYWHENGMNYQAFNDIIGALEGAKMEYYRRRVAYYEMVKCQENGDVLRYVPEHKINAGERSAKATT